MSYLTGYISTLTLALIVMPVFQNVRWKQSSPTRMCRNNGHIGRKSISMRLPSTLSLARRFPHYMAQAVLVPKNSTTNSVCRFDRFDSLLKTSPTDFTVCHAGEFVGISA